MSRQQELHTTARQHLAALAEILEELNDLGPDEYEDDKALREIRERLFELAQR